MITLNFSQLYNGLILSVESLQDRTNHKDESVLMANSHEEKIRKMLSGSLFIAW